MREESRFMSSAALHLEDALDALEQAVVHRNAVEKRLTSSSQKIASLLKRVLKNSANGDRIQLEKLQAAHVKLERKLTKAQLGCNRARAKFEDTQDTFNQRAMARSGNLAALEQELDERKRGEEAMNRALLAAYDRIVGVDPMDSQGLGYELRSGEYDYIPIHIPFFIRMLVQLNQLLHDDPAYAKGPHDYRPVSFLEIGCGTGRNLVLAREAGLVKFETITGFDINPTLIDLGRKVFGLGDALQVGDAMEFDYGQADILFTYRPFSDIEMQMEYESRLAHGMKPGAYLFSPYPLELGRYAMLKPLTGVMNFWRKSD